MMGTLLQDLRFGLRMLAKSPGFAAVAILTLALGIGANTTIFSIVNTVLLRPLPFKSPSRLMILGEGIPELGFPKMGFSAPDLAVLERGQRSLENVGAFQNEDVDISGNGEPERVTAARVSASLFPMLGVEPMLGRTFMPEEDAPGHNVALLSYGFWRRRYGADRGIIGRTIQLNRQPYTVVGVMPEDFEFPLRGPQLNVPAEVWIPMAFTPTELQGWGMYYTNTVLARLRPGVRLEQARADAQSVSRAILADYPPALLRAFRGAQLKVGVYPYHEEVAGMMRTPLLVLMAAVGMVLLIACTNVATLLISRAPSRQKEVAVRRALGATRTRLLRQMVTESLLLALAGGGLGLILAVWGKPLLLSFLPRDLPLARHISMGGSVMVFTLVVCCLTAILFGLAPAFQVSAASLQGSLQEGGRSGTPSRARHRLQGFFVTVEFALALVLLIGAGLLIRSLGKLVRTNPGFRPDHVLTLNLPLPSEAYPNGTEVGQFYEQLLGRTSNLPGVRVVALTSGLPVTGCFAVSVTIEGGSNAEGETPQAVCQTFTLGNYFQAMGIPLLKGRGFTPEDRGDSPAVAVVSLSMARQFWPGQDAIGKRLRWGVYGPWQTIVGIVGDVNDKPLGQPVQVHVYRPYLQLADAFFESSGSGGLRAMNLVVRTQVDPASLTSAVVGQIHSLDPDLAVVDIRTMTQVLSASVAGAKFDTFLLSVFAGVALFLAAIGIYGVLAYAIAQQTHDIGIRLALGADARDVLSLFLRRGMRLAALGSALGLGAALALTRLMASLLYGVKSTDPTTYVMVSLILTAVALLACYIPAKRATKLDPMVALRHE